MRLAIAAAPNGYLNFFLERPAFLLARVDPTQPRSPVRGSVTRN